MPWGWIAAAAVGAMAGSRGGGGGSISYPDLSPEEKQILSQYSKILGVSEQQLLDQANQNAEVLGLLQEVSGLYKTTEVAESRKPDTESVTIDTVGIDRLMSHFRSANSAGARNVTQPNLPPQIVAEAQALAMGRGGVVDQNKYYAEVMRLLTQAKNDPQAALKYGLGQRVVTAGEVIPAHQQRQLDPAAVEALKARYAEIQTIQDQIGKEQAERTLRALRGELPVSQGLMQRKAQEFQLLKENLGRMGHKVDGDTPETAVATSTPAQQALGEFRRTYGLLEDQERRGEIATGYAPAVSYSPGGQALGLLTGAQSYGPGATTAGNAGLLQGYSNLLAPYQNQRVGQFQADYQNSANRAGYLRDIGGLIGNTANSYLLFNAMRQPKVA